ncbi:hypothetical protein D3C80_1759460 [compost metagenome]
MRNALEAHGNQLTRIHGDIADLRQINRSGPGISSLAVITKALEHVRQGVHSLLVYRSDLLGHFSGLQRPAAHGKLELRVEQLRVEPALEHIQDRLGDAFGIAFTLPYQAPRIGLSPTRQQRRQQLLAILEEPVEAGA